MKNKILFLTSRLPFPPIGGDKLRTFNFIKFLKKYYHITLVSFIENETERIIARDYQHLYDKLITSTLPKVISYKNSLAGLFSNKPLQIHYYASKEMSKIVKNELSKGYDILFCHLIRMAQYLEDNTTIPSVVDFTDAISLNYIRSKKYHKGVYSIINQIESRRVFNYEKKIITKTDAAIFISSIDAEFLAKEEYQNKVKVVANGVDFEQFQFYQGDYDVNQILFLGNMRTFPNTDSVVYFVKTIFPLLKKARPHIKFYIVGSEPNKQILRLHNGRDVIVTGFVADVTPYIQKSVVVVAPMRVGAGIQNKILEALSVGTPVVTTSIGAEGLDPDMLTIGNSSEDISRQILSLMENRELRRKKALQGRKYIENNFHWDRVLSKLFDCLESVL